ncbi:MAG: hypothetical protein PHC45_08740 [Clostridiaceae bacterium]|nr:hypothetical protein [Clostridiaceae bacterium]
MFNEKNFLRTVSIFMSTVVLLGAGLLVGCTAVTDDKIESSNNEVNNPPAVEESKQDKVMDEFMTFAEGNPEPDTIIEFMDKNIAEVSKENASKMLDKLEKALKNNLQGLEEKYYSTAIQEAMFNAYKLEFDLSKLDSIQDSEVKDLLEKTKGMGYKVETAEGMFFPIIDYEFLKKFSSYAGDDVKDFIDIMAVESNKVPAKDAALVIGWDEVIERALAQEGFIRKHGSSAKVDDITELQKKYITFMLYGLNNTPLFSYDTKKINPEAKEVYIKAVADNADSELMRLLGRYMEILEKSNYKLSEEADKFRKDAEGKY